MSKKAKKQTDDLSIWDTKDAAREGRDMVVFKPGQTLEPFVDDEGKPWTIRLLGQDSKEYRNSTQRLRTQIWERTVEGNPPSEDELDRLQAEVFAECTVGWHGIVMEGEAVEFSTEKACELYTRFPWLLKRVAAFVENHANFTKRL